jgi:aspartyl/glutamyl-tRNA(Asn/Gln) amidotransferase C subunit
LEYFKQLQSLDTRNIPITSQVIDLVNVTRHDEDKPTDEDIKTAILDNAPQSSGRYFKVNKII